MSTTNHAHSLAGALFGDIRLAVVTVFFRDPDRSLYLRQVIRRVGGGQGAVQRELKSLADAGILSKSQIGRHVYFQANPDCSIFSELRSLIMKTTGLADILRNALQPLAARIEIAFVYGSFAKGHDTAGSDVDLMVIGDVTFQDIVNSLYEVQEFLGREVNPTVFPAQEFIAKISESNGFLDRVLSGEKIFLVGDENELAKLARKRVVD